MADRDGWWVGGFNTREVGGSTLKGNLISIFVMGNQTSCRASKLKLYTGNR